MALGRIIDIADAATTVVQGSVEGDRFGGQIALLDLFGSDRADLVTTAIPTPGSPQIVLVAGAPAATLGETRQTVALAAFQTAAVTALGDVDGDGRDDLGVTQTNGVALVVYGDAAGFAGEPTLDDLLGAGRATVVAQPAEFSFGTLALIALGDVDGDGKADLGLGGGPFGREAGRLLAILPGAGFAERPAVLDAGESGIAVLAPAPDTTQIRHFAGLGDIDGDGRDDFAVVVDPTADPGEILVQFGDPGLTPGGLPDGLQTGNAGTLRILAGEGLSGSSGAMRVAGAGDLNADGIDDLVVIMQATAAGETPEGATRMLDRVFLLFGDADLRGATVTLQDAAAELAPFGALADGRGLAILPEGEDASSGAGQLFLAAGPAGDVTGDGVDDLVLGREFFFGQNYGQIYVLPGSAELADTAVLDLADPAGPALATRIDLGPLAVVGTARPTLAVGGDVDGDGVNDIALGVAGSFPAVPGAIHLIEGGGRLLDAQPPGARDDAVRVARDNTVVVAVLDNDQRTSNRLDPASVTIVQAPAQGTASMLPDGSIRFDPAGSTAGTVSFSYTVADLDGRVSNAATVTATVVDVPLVLRPTTGSDVVDDDPTTLSLREAVALGNLAGGPRVIELGALHYVFNTVDPPETANADAPIAVLGDITLRGSNTTITARQDGLERLFSVAAGASLTVEDVDLEAFYRDSRGGGAFEVAGGTLRLDGVSFDNFGMGREVLVRTTRDEIVNDPVGGIGKSYISVTETYATGFGAAIHNLGGIVEVVGSEFTGNYALSGGAIATLGGRVEVTDSTFRGNGSLATARTSHTTSTSVKAGTPENEGEETPVKGLRTTVTEGPLIYGTGAAIHSIDGVVDLLRVVFDDNQAATQHSGVEGATVFADAPGALVLNEVSFINDSNPFHALDESGPGEAAALAPPRSAGAAAAPAIDFTAGFDLAGLAQGRAPLLSFGAGGILELTPTKVRLDLAGFVLELTGEGLGLDLANFDPTDPTSLKALAGRVTGARLTDKATGQVVASAHDLDLAAATIQGLLDNGFETNESLLQALGITAALRGSPGADTLEGGGGADTLAGRDGDDLVQGLDGADRLVGDNGADTLEGGEGRDTLVGGAGNDLLLGQGGNDLISSQGAADTLAGGEGDDRYRLGDAGDTVIELMGGGIDVVVAAFDVTLGPNLEGLRLLGSADLSGTGNALGNRLAGNAGANLLRGGAGNDALLGGGGADTLEGGPGRDRLVGGAGPDHFVFGAPEPQADRILDFDTGEDSIVLLGSGFGGLLAGSLAGQAVGSTQRFIHNASGTADAPAGEWQLVLDDTTGLLVFDANGIADGGRVGLARLGVGTALAAADLLIG
jgi:Ca2+-binding RTX toxin-like protein